MGPPAGAPSADDMKEARRHFAVGNDLYKDQRYAEALLEFNAAYHLSGRPAALLNVGDCQRQLNEYVDAYETYQAVLARHAAQLSAADKSAVQKAVDYLDAHTGLLAVSANEAGAEVVVDDRVLGRTPLAAPLRVDVGSHKIIVRKEGFVPFVPPSEVQLLSKQLVKVEATLAPEVVTGHLSVREETGREVHVFVDGADQGPAPWEGDLAPGLHTVEAKGERFAGEMRPVTLAKGQRLDLMITAEPLTGHLRIAAPGGATIDVDHRRVGAGSWEGDVATGPHHIDVALGEVRAARDVMVGRGAMVAQEIPLAAAAAKPRQYGGLYATLGVSGFLSGSSPKIDTAVKGGTIFGLGGIVQVGYNFGVVSAELATALSASGFGPDECLQGNCSSSHIATDSLKGINAFFGPGIRVTSRDPTARFTASVASVLAVRNFTLDRQPDSDRPDSAFHQSAGYAAPGILFDAALLFGGSSGPEFSLGVFGSVDFPSKDIVVGPEKSPALSDSFFTAPGRGYLLASGPQVFVGPALGVQFGQ